MNACRSTVVRPQDEHKTQQLCSVQSPIFHLKIQAFAL